jgi:type I restriction enzyme R subunit
MSFRLYDFVGVTRDFNDESYNPYSDIKTHRTGIPWGTEIDELTEEEKNIPETIRKLFVQIPENAPENTDLIVKREHVEIGPQGERIDIEEYQNRFENKIQKLLETDKLLQKVKAGEELSDDEIEKLAEKLNSPDFYFNEANLRAAYHYPEGTLSEFIKSALKLFELPNEEQHTERKINDLFEAWLIERNFSSNQSRILRMVKNQYLTNKEKIDVSIFNQPLFNQFGGLQAVLRIFGEKEIQETLKELNTKIFE